MKKYVLLIAMLFCYIAVHAQILYTETFDNLALGEVSQDPTGATAGKGGWYVKKELKPYTFPVEIVPEVGRGNVLVIGTNVNSVNGLGNGARLTQKNINVMWDNRIAGNNVLKLEYDAYFEKTSEIRDLHVALRNSNYVNTSIFGIDNSINNQVSSASAYVGLSYWNNNNYSNLTLGTNSTNEYNNFPYNSWFSIQLYVEYKYENGVQLGGSIYVYIPALNILKKTNFTHDNIIELLTFFGWGRGNSSVAVKYDNIKITALKNVPLSVSTFLNNKFNLYPNPATSIVNINSAENTPVSKITVYDVAGKLLSTQNFNNQTNIQLNTENLASGTYLLHIETSEGTAVKKLVKK